MDQICSRAQQRATLRFGPRRGQGVATKRDAGAASRRLGATDALWRLASSTIEPHLPGMSTRSHSSLREGVILGAVVGTGIWVWIALVDAIVGEPFRTFFVLGGVARFTTLHYVLCLTYGVVAVSVVHAAAREASLMVGAAFAFFLLELGFVMASAILSQVGLGGLAWARILGGNVVGVALTLLMLWRRHPLAHGLRDGTAEGEE